MDFYFGRIKVFCNAVEAHEVIGEPDISMEHHRLPSIADSSAPQHYLDFSKHPRGANLAGYIGAHFNYHERRYFHFSKTSTLISIT